MTRSIEGLLARIQHPPLKRMVALWHEKRAGRDWPLRRDFDPLEFGFAAGYVSLVDVQDKGSGGRRRLYFRLEGTKQVDLFGVDCTGKFLDQAAAPASARTAEQSFAAAIETGTPQYHARFVESSQRLVGYEIAVLPLSRGGDRIDMLMTVVVPNGCISPTACAIARPASATCSTCS